MADYAADHADALASVADAGAAVTFTLESPGTYVEATDTFTPTTMTTCSGYAIEVAGNPETYDRLSLVLSSAPSLFFTPSTYGDLPRPGYGTIWNAKPYTVKDVLPLAPNGPAIAATVVIAA